MMKFDDSDDIVSVPVVKQSSVQPAKLKKQRASKKLVEAVAPSVDILDLKKKIKALKTEKKVVKPIVPTRPVTPPVQAHLSDDEEVESPPIRELVKKVASVKVSKSEPINIPEKAKVNRKPSSWSNFVKANMSKVADVPNNQRFSALAKLYKDSKRV